MQRKVEKELKSAQSDLKDAIRTERERAASVSELKEQSVNMESNLGAFQEESKQAKNRIWWKSVKWMAAACLLAFIVVGAIFLYIASKVKQIFSSS